MRNWQWCCSYKWMFVESGGQRVGRFGSWTGKLFFFKKKTLLYSCLSLTVHADGLGVNFFFSFLFLFF